MTITPLVVTEMAGRLGYYMGTNGSILSESAAKSRGYHLVTQNDMKQQREGDKPKATLTGNPSKDAYAEAVLALPEATNRPSAVMKIIKSYDANSLPVARAAIMLRSLPLEDHTPAKAITPNIATARADNEMIKRKAELRFAALSQRADRGDDSARHEANRIAYGLKVHTQTNVQITKALELARVDLSSIN